MAASRYPTTQYLAGNFVLSAGSVLFRRRTALTNSVLPDYQICILHHLDHNEFLLPKGRKDQGERLEDAAMRETYEETGYRCSLWRVRMPTRAPAPLATGHSSDDREELPRLQEPNERRVVDDIAEPISVTIRDLGVDASSSEPKSKLIFWYITICPPGTEKEQNTQMENENFDSVWVDVEEAERRLTFQNDIDIVRCAVDIVRESL
ncbi:hypothetical protein D9613_002409 [Agrocybe pediades]|uniref:Nudix hydrolase domain-containing protein n=1 Tax=Agrocybe pediades TaxID=84607 RepID=A0A8H4R3Z3_9AGAR|nr:hypothetical protein D9613_002409 [Agrocybe pediades]